MGHTLPDHGLATLISEAALDPLKWAQVCERAASIIGGCGALMFPLGPEFAKMGLPHSKSLEESFQHYIRDDWHTRDVRFDGVETMRKRGFVTDVDCLPYDEIDHSSYYQEFLRPNKLKWFAGIGIGSGSNFWVLSLQQAMDKDPFSLKDIQKILGYRQLLDSAAQISRELGFAKITAIASIMEHHYRAVIALGFDGRVVHMSQLAEKLVGKAYKIVQGRLQARDEKDRLPLERLVANLSNTIIPNSATHPIPLSNGPEKSKLVVYGMVLPEQQRQTFSRATALLMIVDPERDLNFSPDLMMDYYDITRAEAKLAISLLHGKSVETHSAENAISPVTARNHLQGLLRKTASHSKAELITKLNSIRLI